MYNHREATMLLEQAHAKLSKVDDVIRIAQSSVMELKKELATALYAYHVLETGDYDDVVVLDKRIQQQKLITEYQIRLRQFASLKLSEAEGRKGLAPTPTAVSHDAEWEAAVDEFARTGSVFQLRNTAAELRKRVECEKVITEYRA